MRLLRLLPCLLAAIPATLSNSGATAQDCYYVTDLRELGASLYDLPTFAINDDGVVAFTAKVDNRFHAFVWLPVEEYGLPAGVPIDIHPQGLGVSADDSAVHDISNSGYVVGVLDQFTTAPRAFAWKLGNPIVPLDLSDPTQFPPPAGYEEFIPRQLFGVNDNPTPMAVGYADSLWQCGCPPSGAPEVSTVLGFSVTLQAGSGFNVQEPKVDPDNDDCDQSTVSRDINNAYEVVGSSSKAGGPSCYPPSGECVPDARDAASWSYDPPFVELVDLGTQSEVLRNNHGGQLVGVGWEDDGPCDNDAMFWESRTSPYFNLGALAEVADSETSAQGITDPDPNGRIQVVGWNESEDLGLVWTRETPESDWQVYDLNNHLVRCSTGWAIFRADDVSDSGLIIAIADPEGGNVVTVRPTQPPRPAACAA